MINSYYLTVSLPLWFRNWKSGYPPTLDARLSPAVSTSPSRGEVIRSTHSLPPRGLRGHP